jgi:Transmembrane protein 65
LIFLNPYDISNILPSFLSQGDYIDLTIGMTLGISTMAAAALGNTISDVAGIGSAWYGTFIMN